MSFTGGTMKRILCLFLGLAVAAFMALGSKAYAAGAESLSLSVSDGWAVFSAIVEAGAFSLAWWQWRQNKHRREEDFIAALFLARSTFATFDGAIKKLLTFILEDAGRRRLGPFSIDRGRNETQLLHRSTVLAAGSAHADALRNLSDYVSAKDRKRIALILDQLAECQFADSDSALLQSAIEARDRSRDLLSGIGPQEFGRHHSDDLGQPKSAYRRR